MARSTRRKRSTKRSSSSEVKSSYAALHKEEENDLEKTVDNYKTRLKESGLEEEADSRNALEKLLNLPEDQNFLFDIAEIIGRPQQALFGAIDAAQKGEDAGEAALKGLTGEKKTSGGQLLRNAGIGDDNNGSAKLTDMSTWGVDDILGLGLDIFLDPVDLALIPVTGGTNIAVSTAADNVKNLSKVTDAAKAASTASDAAKGFTLASKAGDAADIAKVAAGLDTVENVTVPIKYKETLLNYLTQQTGKGVKKAATKADNAIEWILGKADDARVNDVMKKAISQGREVTEDVLKSADYKSLLGSYKAIKNDLSNIFNYAKALPGNLINKGRQAKGSAQMATYRAGVVLQDANQRLDDYVYNLVKNQGIDLSDLDNYINSTGRLDIDDFLESLRKSNGFEAMANDPNSIYNLLYNTKNQISLDVRDLIESGMDTKIDGTTVLSNLGKKGADGTFKGTKESVDAIANYLDSRGIKYVYRVDPQGLGYTLSIKRKANNLRAFNEIQKQQSTIDAFRNMDLNKSLGYTEDELKRIAELQANPDLQALADTVNQDYDELARIFEEELGVDYSGITDRGGYVRRSLANGDNPFENLPSGNKSGNVDTKAFASRKYPYPSIVTERIKGGDMSGVGESLKAQGVTGSNIGLNEQQIAIKKIDSEIKRLNSQLSYNKKETLTNAANTLKEKINTTIGPSKTQQSIEAGIAQATAKEQKARKVIEDAHNSITEDIVNKMNSMPNASVTKNFIKKSQKFGAAEKAYNDYLDEFVKKFSKQGTFTETEYTKALKKLDDLEQARLNAAYDIQIATSKVSGSIDNTTKSLIKNTNKTFSNVSSAEKALNETAARKEILAARKEVADAAQQEMHRSLTNKLQNVEEALKDLLAKDPDLLAQQDEKLLKQIESLQKTRDILDSAQGTKLFNDNYISGMNDFINYASKNAAGAKIYNEAIMNGTFYDDSLMLSSKDTLTKDLIPQNMIKLDAQRVSQMKAQLQSVKGILPNNTKAINDLLDYIGTNNVYMDKNLANLLNFANKADPKPLLNLVNGFNNVFKQFSIMSPGFLARNVTGNGINLILSGVPASQIPNLYVRASKLLDDDFVLDLIRKANAGTLTAAERTQFDLLRQFVSNGFYKAGTGVQDLGEIVTRAYNATEEPLSNFEQLTQAVGGTTVQQVKDKTLGRVSNFIATANDKLDSLNRMAALIYGNEHPTYFRRLGFDNAADAVRYALFDPGNMSPTEINTIKKIIPFYTFTKQNLIYQVTNVAKNTSKYHQLIKAFDIAYDSMDEDSYRDYQKENFQLPLPFEDEDGNTIMLKMNLPVNDLTIFSSPKEVLRKAVSSTTPLIRAPFEQVTGIDTYTGQEQYRTGVEQLANYLGISNITTNVWDKIEAIISKYNGDMTSAEMWTEIFNSLAQYNNREKIRNSNLYEEMEYYSGLVSDLKKQGIEVPTINELSNASSSSLTQLQRKRNKRNNSN